MLNTVLQGMESNKYNLEEHDMYMYMIIHKIAQNCASSDDALADGSSGDGADVDWIVECESSGVIEEVSRATWAWSERRHGDKRILTYCRRLYGSPRGDGSACVESSLWAVCNDMFRVATEEAWSF